ncbi:MAG: YedE family putative selenium transporter [bacterium]
MKWLKGDGLLIMASGLALGFFGAALVFWGNPANSGICISCFTENLAGALGLHANTRMAYLRPELVGFIAGAFLVALAGKEFRPRAGRLPVHGFILGVFLIVGSSVFMGCPIKVILRLAAGDMTALAGLGGLAAGIFIGIRFLKSGLDLGDETAPSAPFQGAIVPLIFIALFILSLAVPGLLIRGETGPAAHAAPVAISLSAGLLIGALAQRSRFCVAGSFSNLFLARDWSLMRGLLILLVSATAVNIYLGFFRMGMMDQPGSHPDHLWNGMSMLLVGFASVLAGGCPFRQLVLAGEGLVDASVVIVGMVVGGSIVHLWQITSTAAGPTPAGKVAVLLGLIYCFAVVRFHRREG